MTIYGQVTPAGNGYGTSFSGIENWRFRAACSGPDVDPEWWYAPVSEPDDRAKAIAVCHTCPVIEQCRQAVIDAGDREGIWAGVTAESRGRYPVSLWGPLMRKEATRRELEAMRAEIRQQRDAEKKEPVTRPVCGSNAGDVAHRVRGERPCADCAAWARKNNQRRRREAKALERARMGATA